MIRLVGEGYCNREIGAELGISEETVKSHVRKSLAALGARSRAHAVAITLRGDLSQKSETPLDGAPAEA